MSEMLGTNKMPEIVAQLQQRLALQPRQRYDVVLENDLAGRAALALMWPQRSQLTVYLISDDLADRNVRAIKSALLTVRNPPAVHVVSAASAAALAGSSERLVWCVAPDRTNNEARAALNRRILDDTHVPYAKPIAALGDRRPDQTDAAHELILRDILEEHTPFLNFFGDRFDARDLYERSKYPHWFTPPPGFSAALAPLLYRTVTTEGAVVDSETFDGSLQLPPKHIQVGHRLQIDLTPIIGTVDAADHDLSVYIDNAYVNPDAAGMLAIEVHDERGLHQRFDVATTPAQLHVPIRAIRPGSGLKISVVALRDNPKPSWSIASRTDVQLVMHAPGTHPTPRLKARVRSWLDRAKQRRQRGK